MVARVTLALMLLGCGAGAASYEGQSQPSADALFRGEPRWLGGDAAYSVPLDDERVLWLFGDSFVATSDALVRSESVLVRNSVAVQTGRCPDDATMRFSWREDDEPSAFVPSEGEVWLWPLHGITLDGALTLFWLEVAPSDGDLGFAAVGWRALRADDVTGSPDGWTFRELGGFEAPFEDVAVGTAVLAHEDHVYAYAVREPGNHDVFLVRWTRAGFVAGELGAPEWWDEGWVPHAELDAEPARVFGDAQTELSVSYDGERFVEVQTVGFGATTIGVRTAPAPEGPWGELGDAFRPEESDRADAFVYAGKAHPELDCGEGRLWVTYAANSFDFGTLVNDASLYWPRFVTLRPR